MPLAADTLWMSRIVGPLTVRARALRRSETPAERELWRWLRGRKLEGVKFRRQPPLGPFIVDFFCEEERLVIEADGAGHFPPPLRDRSREHWFAAAGLTVLRFENGQVLDQTASVLERIRVAIREARATRLCSPLLREQGERILGRRKSIPFSVMAT